MTEAAKGWILPELVIDGALRTGFADIRAAIAGNTIDEYLARTFWAPSPEAEAVLAPIRAKVKAWLPTIKSERESFVIRGYPETQQELPCIAVTLLAERQGEYLGDAGGLVEFPDGSIGTEDVEKWESPIGLVCYEQNGDALVWLYHLTKFIVAGQRRQLVAVFNLQFGLSGRDLGFAKEFGGRNVRSRLLQVTGEYEQFNAEREPATDVDDVIPNQTSEYADLDTH